ncbi:hypothetical protein [Polyangium spumosum]|uniref:Uncharacterized protein n=1 Tax=Polyangium spumosum TaxID=889282 RepID=A0A6N7Q2Q3_9BACT|nr:hypothetical protein [Polyangium spumosum]MRG98553.1 hypothetical protein [Polyangium spumosum]
MSVASSALALPVSLVVSDAGSAALPASASATLGFVRACFFCVAALAASRLVLFFALPALFFLVLAFTMGGIVWSVLEIPKFSARGPRSGRA